MDLQLLDSGPPLQLGLTEKLFSLRDHLDCSPHYLFLGLEAQQLHSHTVSVGEPFGLSTL